MSESPLEDAALGLPPPLPAMEDITSVSPFARSTAFDEPRLSSREQTVSFRQQLYPSY